jgi:hypothetical protein
LAHPGTIKGSYTEYTVTVYIPLFYLPLVILVVRMVRVVRVGKVARVSMVGKVAMVCDDGKSVKC